MPGMLHLRGCLIAAIALLASPVSALADPGPADPAGAPPAPAAEAAQMAVPAPGPPPAADGAPAAVPPAAPVDDGRVASSPPATSTMDGVTLAISAKDELQTPVQPLITAISTREYLVGGVFDGSVTGASAVPEGIFEVGYQIGCGIDMATSGGVLLGGNVGGTAVSDVAIPSLAGIPLLPVPVIGVGAGVAGIVGVNLKPGIINTIPVTKKPYKGAAPEVQISDFRIRIDGCVGQSFIRSYATLARSTGEVEDIVSWFGVTKAV